MDESGKHRRLAVGQIAANQEERAFWAANLVNLAASTALNGDALDRRKVGLAWLFLTSLFQYRIRLDFGVDKFSPAEAKAGPTCIDTKGKH